MLPLRSSPVLRRTHPSLSRSCLPAFALTALLTSHPSFPLAPVPATAFSATPARSASAAQMSYIDKLALILVRDRKQLVARSRGKTAFFTPGGKREGDESDIDALCRECREELTVDLREDTVRPYGTFEAQAFGKPEGTVVRMTCYAADYDGELRASEEVEELKWIESDFDREQLTVTGIMILEDLKGKDLID